MHKYNTHIQSSSLRTFQFVFFLLVSYCSCCKGIKYTWHVVWVKGRLLGNVCTVFLYREGLRITHSLAVLVVLPSLCCCSLQASETSFGVSACVHVSSEEDRVSARVTNASLGMYQQGRTYMTYRASAFSAKYEWCWRLIHVLCSEQLFLVCLADEATVPAFQIFVLAHFWCQSFVKNTVVLWVGRLVIVHEFQWWQFASWSLVSAWLEVCVRNGIWCKIFAKSNTIRCGDPESSLSYSMF